MSNKVVLVTGSTRGIGKATILEFAKKGYDVVINYVKNDELAKTLKEEIESTYKVKALAIKADITSEVEVDNMVKQIVNEFGHLDVLVNNAGIAIDKEFDDRTPEDWSKTLTTNLIGTFIVAKRVGEVMLNQKKGNIINVSSTNGINSFFPTSIDYDASKAGLINLTHNLAIQYAPFINVNCVAPGWVNTEMNRELPKDLIDGETERIYKKRFAEPSEIGKVICFLASEDAEFVNDEVIKIDGGYC